MRLRVLGCSGGIGGRHLRTTSFLVDSDVLIDAGTGVGDLSLAELTQIDHIFVTHSHLDHVASIPFLVDTVGGMRAKPIIVHATRETIDILKNHLFNWEIWPDFTQIPTPQTPFMRYEEIELGRRRCRSRAHAFTPLPANHTVPAVGYLLDSGRGSLVFTGDTGPNDALWAIVNRLDNLQVPDHRDRVRQQGAPPRRALQAPVPVDAGRGAGQVRARRGDLRHAPQARRDRAHHAGDRGVRAAHCSRACCRTTRFSNFDRARSRARS